MISVVSPVALPLYQAWNWLCQSANSSGARKYRNNNAALILAPCAHLLEVQVTPPNDSVAVITAQRYIMILQIQLNPEIQPLQMFLLALYK